MKIFQIIISIYKWTMIIKLIFPINKMINKTIRIKKYKNIKILMKIICLKANNLFIHKLRTILKKWEVADILHKIKLHIINKIKAISNLMITIN